MITIITPRATPRVGLVMHPDKVREFQNQRHIFESQLAQKRKEWSNDGRWFTNPPTDRDAIRKKIKDIDRSLQLGAPLDTTGRRKDVLWARAKVLIDELRIGMPNKYEMHPMQLNPATGVISKDTDTLDRAVKKHMAWESKNKRNIIELKNIARTLGEPELGNIERIRPRQMSQASRFVTK